MVKGQRAAGRPARRRAQPHRDVIATRIFEGLLRGALGRDDLTARRLASYVGQSTIFVYHHYGSLDGLLIRVDGAGWTHLFEILRDRETRGADGPALAEAFLEFAFEHPALYWLMTERPFDRVRLAAEGRLSLAEPIWSAFVALTERHGARAPELDAQALLGGLHGLAALELGGRASLGAPAADTRARTFAAARHLARTLLPGRSRRPTRR